MKFIVKHEINGRLRIHVVQKRMTYTEADTLSWFLSNQKNVTDVKVYERTADAVICYVGDKEEVIVWPINHTDVASSKRTCFAHYI